MHFTCVIYNDRVKITKYFTDQLFHKIYGSGPKTYTQYHKTYTSCVTDIIHASELFNFILYADDTTLNSTLDLHGTTTVK